MRQTRAEGPAVRLLPHRVTIIFKNLTLATTSNPDEETLIKKLCPDQAAYKREEQRRFEILPRTGTCRSPTSLGRPAECAIWFCGKAWRKGTLGVICGACAAFFLARLRTGLFVGCRPMTLACL